MANFDLRVHAKLDGSTWTDISTDVQYEERVSIREGAGNQGGRIDNGSCLFRLRNDDGQWSPGNPESPNFPNWGRGVEVRVGVHAGEVAFLAEDTETSAIAFTADDASLDITGDIDVRIEFALWNADHPQEPAGVNLVELIGKYYASPNRSWFFGIDDGFPYLEWSPDGNSVMSATATDLLRIPGSNPRMALRVTLDVDNGLGGYTATFYRSDSIGGDWELIGEPIVTTAGTTSISASAVPLQIGHATAFAFRPRPQGSFFKAEVRDGIDGTVVANPDFTAQTDGSTSFTDGAGRLWGLSGSAEITNRKTRFSGEVASVAPGRDRRNYKFVDVEVGGRLRRLGANDEKLKSAVYRDITSPNRQNIIAYWPMEDGSAATEFASPLDNIDPAKIVGEVDPASYSQWGASSPIPTFDEGYVAAPMPAYPVTGETSVRFFLALPSTGVPATRSLIALFTTGTGAVWVVDVDTSGGTQMRVVDESGVSVYSSGFTAFALNGLQRTITVELTQNGANVDWSVITTTVTPPLVVSGSSGTVPTRTVGMVKSVRLNDGRDLSGTAIGQLSVADALDAYAGSAESATNWQTEGSVHRAGRLCEEEGVPISFSGFSEAPQGGQGESDLVTLIRDVAATEQALFGETRHAIGLFYRTSDSLSSQEPAFEIGYGDGSVVDPFDPVYDDSELVNDFTAERRDGGFARYREEEGRLSVNDVPAGVGPYEGSDTFNVAYDHQTGDLAAWLVHLGTFEGARFSRLRVRLDKLPALADDFCRAYIGDIGVITGAPLDLAGTDDIRLRIEGYSETIDQFEWTIDYVMSPGEPWSTGFAGYDDTAFREEQFAWADTSGSELAEALTSTETDVSILTTSGPVWSSDPFDSPYMLKASGEHMLVQAPGSFVSPNPLFTADATSWEGSGASVARTVSVVHPHPDAVASLAITPDGVTASARGQTTLSAVGAVVAGQRYVVSCWVRLTSASASVRPEVLWYDSAGSFLSSSGTAASASASEWTFLQETVTAPASASRYRIAVRLDGTPPSSDVFWTWAPRLTLVKASEVYDEFGRSATDTWASADSGQTWANTGGVAADFDVLSGYGRHIQTATGVALASSITSSSPDFDIYCDMTVAATSTGASQFTYIMGRRTDSSNLYQLRADFTTTGSVNLTIRKRLAAVEVALDTATAAATYVAGTFLRFRFQGFGSELKGKVWALTGEEPHNWDVEASDPDLTSGTIVGVRSARNTGNTNANADLRFDNFDLITPQAFTVERSANSVVKTQAAGEDVRLAFPAVPGI